MKTKAAVQFTLDGPLELVDLEVPDPSENQVIVKMYSSGVCHSQLHQMANPNLPRPLVLGHEGTGIVTKTGKNVSHVSEGDHVIVTWVKRVETQGSIPAELTGASYHETPVNGNVYTLGEDVLTNSDYVVPISKEYPTDISCIVGCAVLTGAGAVINTAQVKPGESVAVFGVGGVGLCAIQAASISKANPVIAVDLDSEKLKFAQEFGATHALCDRHGRGAVCLACEQRGCDEPPSGLSCCGMTCLCRIHPSCSFLPRVGSIQFVGPAPR